MARWEPPNKVGANEHVGRRLFDEPMLAGAVDQPNWNGIQVTHFEERRGVDYSLDRLGRSCIDKKTIRYLTPRAECDAKKFHKPKRFDGWFVLVARELIGENLEPQASPIDGVELEENVYHAHVLRPQDVTAELMAFRLRQLFTTRGRIETVSSKQPIQQEAQSFIDRLGRVFDNWLRKLGRSHD